MTPIEQSTPSVTLGNLDGLLAVAFTTPGKRFVSVQDARSKLKLNEAACEQAVAKVSTVVERLIRYTRSQEQRAPEGIAALLKMYARNPPVLPVFKPKGKSNVTIPMTIDPMLGYSTRHPLSDGHIADNTNLAVPDMPLAAVLAFLGASRFLRAQRCANNLVNLYMPLPTG